MFKYLVTLIVSSFILQGCYTVIWDPMTMEFPREDNSITTPTYYEEVDYYGRYSSYYNVPWWYSISPPSAFKVEPSSSEQNKSVESLRESIGGRNSAGRENNSVSPPSRNSSGSSSTTTTSGSNSDSRTNSKDSTTNERTSTKRESTKTNDARQTRGDGERSSEPKRR
ncbi:MAG: hypothetical protein Q8N03_03605 [Ignavibacteria bacterium]|nr:hypothetical protein [Ignavibacteria bacterium]MDP3830421.1 hypothetical protein [Ignavibacteriaceae bacterium]